MNRWFIFLLFLIFAFRPAAQQNDFMKRVAGLINARNFSEAEKLVDAQLKSNPSADAWVMKGNILLNYSWLYSTHQYINMTVAESPSDTSRETITWVSIIPDDTCKQVEHYFKKAFALDSSRNDILMGLCNLYSISLRTKDLMKTLPALQARYRFDGTKAYAFSEYARNLKERGAFEDAMLVYKWVAAAYPDEAGIRADIAGEYFYSGRPVDALHYIDSALMKKEVDDITLINCASIYSMLNYFDDAQKVFGRYSRAYNNLISDFYHCLSLYSTNHATALDSLQSFVYRADPSNYADELALADQIVSSNAVLDEEAFMGQTTDGVPPYYLSLICRKAMNSKDVGVKCKGYYKAAELFAAQQMWQVALDYIEEDTCLSSNESFALEKGYLQLQTKDYVQCIASLKPLTETTGWKADAARYFSARAYIELKKSDAAKQQLHNIMPAGANKYQLLKSILLSSMK